MFWKRKPIYLADHNILKVTKELMEAVAKTLAINLELNETNRELKDQAQKLVIEADNSFLSRHKYLIEQLDMLSSHNRELQQTLTKITVSSYSDLVEMQRQLQRLRTELRSKETND